MQKMHFKAKLQSLPMICVDKCFHTQTHLVVADFYVLLHNDPGDGLRQRGGCQRAVVRPVVISVGG